MSATQPLNLRCDMERTSAITIAAAPSGGLTCSQVYYSNNLMGIIVTDVDEDEKVSMLYEIPSPGILMPCDEVGTGDFGLGSPVYAISGETKVYCTEVSSSYLVGYVVEAPALAAEAVLVHWMGDIHNYV